MIRIGHRNVSAFLLAGLLSGLPYGLATAALVNPGDILTADLNGRVLKVDPGTGAFAVLASGGFLVNPVGIVVEASGKIVVSDVGAQGSAAIIRIDPANGAQSLVSSGGLLSNPDGIAIDASNRLLVTDLLNKSVVRVDPVTGSQTLVTQNGLLVTPAFLAVDIDGSILVTDPGAAAGTGAIIRVDPTSGAQSILSSGDNFTHPIGIVIDGCGRILVSDINAQTGAVMEIDRVSGTQTILSSGGLTGKARGIGLEPAGTVLITAETLPLIVRIGQDGTRSVVAEDPGMGVPYGITTYHPGQAPGCFTLQPPHNGPTLVSVRDVPNDQGGKVFLRWLASDLDVPAQQQITGYRIWRRLPPVTAAERLVTAQHSGATDPDRPLMTRTRLASGDVAFWEAVATVPAGFLSGYGYTAATTQDSLPNSNPLTSFFVSALTSDPFVFYPSNEDSGYSVDNLAPTQPSPFTAVYLPGEAHLHWGKNQEDDLAGYRLYRGLNQDFAPSPSDLVVASPDTGYVDHSGGIFYYYKLSAVDVHGNEGHYALVAPNAPTASLAALVDAKWEGGAVDLSWIASGNPGLLATLYRRTPVTDWSSIASLSADEQGSIRYRDTDVQPGAQYAYRLGIFDGDHDVFAGEAWVSVPALRLALAGALTNPISRSDFSVAFTLPSAAPASLEVFDVSGRLLESREVGGLGAGNHEVRLALRSGTSSGVVLIRLRQSGLVITSRAVVLP